MNMYAPHRKLYFISDAPHLLKLPGTVYTILVMENSPGIYGMKTNLYCGHTSEH